MKELTKKQKFEFIAWALEEIEKNRLDFFVCNELHTYFDFPISNILKAFPELLLFSRYKEFIQYWDDDNKTTWEEDNEVRKIILSFLYNWFK